MAQEKSRLSRWSRLKSKGGTTSEENELARQARDGEKAPGTPATQPQSATLESDLLITGDFPENRFRRSVAPVMAPLAGTEEGESALEAPPQEALDMLNGERVHESAPGINGVTSRGADHAEGDAEPELTPEEAEYMATLPPLESLTEESDFTPFLTEKVPEFLRRKALRVLYRSHPVLALRDGLNDYDEDYNLLDSLIDASTQSSYQVGKGQKAAQEEVPETQIAETAAEDSAAPPPCGPATPEAIEADAEATQAPAENGETEPQSPAPTASESESGDMESVAETDGDAAIDKGPSGHSKDDKVL